MNATHRHEIPLRWADLDTLNHVNNVVYVRYAAEARARLVADGVLDDARTTRMDVEFLRPIQFGPRPAVVTTHSEDDQLVQQIGLEGSPHAYARIVSGRAPVGTVAPAEHASSVPLFLRSVDLGERGVVDPVNVFELLQESRVPYMRSLVTDRERGTVALAHLGVNFHAAIAWRREPIESRAWIERVGDSSYTVGAQLCVDDRVAVSSYAVLVGFDAQTQRSRRMSGTERAALSRGLRVDPSLSPSS